MILMLAVPYREAESSRRLEPLPHGRRDEDVLQHVHIENSHAAVEVLVAARGPGAERVRGYLPNTRLFYVMMEAYGWAP